MVKNGLQASWSHRASPIAETLVSPCWRYPELLKALTFADNEPTDRTDDDHTDTNHIVVQSELHDTGGKTETR